MIKKLTLVFLCLSLLFLTACEKDAEAPESTEEETEIENEIVDLEMNVLNVGPLVANINFAIPNDYTNKTILWGSTENLKLDLSENKKPIIDEGNEAILPNLNQGTNYFIRVAALDGNTVHYSPVTSFQTTSVAITFDNTLPGFTSDDLFRTVIKSNDHYYAVLHHYDSSGYDNSYATIVKLDENFQLIWRKIVNEGSNTDRFCSIVTLQNGDLLVAMNKFVPSIGPPYDQHQSYIVRLDAESGSRIWTKYYDYQPGTEDWVNVFGSQQNVSQDNDGTIKFYKNVDVTQVNTNDIFAVEIEIDENGNLINTTDLGHSVYSNLYRFTFNKQGDRYAHGINATAEQYLAKINDNYQNIWYNSYGRGQSSGGVEHILFEDNFIYFSSSQTLLSNGDLLKTNFITKSTNNGDLVWSYKLVDYPEMFPNPHNGSYKGKDTRLDNEKNIISLYNESDDMNQNFISILSLSQEGELNWKFNEINADNSPFYQAEKIFVEDKVYTTIGSRNGNIWIRQFTFHETD